MIEELKQVRDALEQIVQIHRDYADDEMGSPDDAEAFESVIVSREAIAALDRLSSPVQDDKHTIEGLRHSLKAAQEGWADEINRHGNTKLKLECKSEAFDTATKILAAIACERMEQSAPVGVKNPDLATAMSIVFDAGYKIHGQFGWVTDQRGVYNTLQNAAPTPATKLQKDVNLVDGVNDCKFEAPAPTAVDLDKIKRDLLPSVCLIKKHSDIVSCIVDELAAKYDLARKV